MKYIHEKTMRILARSTAVALFVCFVTIGFSADLVADDSKIDYPILPVQSEVFGAKIISPGNQSQGTEDTCELFFENNPIEGKYMYDCLGYYGSYQRDYGFDKFFDLFNRNYFQIDAKGVLNVGSFVSDSYFFKMFLNHDVLCAVEKNTNITTFYRISTHKKLSQFSKFNNERYRTFYTNGLLDVVNERYAVLRQEPMFYIFDYVEDEIIFEKEFLYNSFIDIFVQYDDKHIVSKYAIMNLETEEIVDISNLGLSQFHRKVFFFDDYIEFLTSCHITPRTEDYNPDYVRVGYDGKIIEKGDIHFQRDKDRVSILHATPDRFITLYWHDENVNDPNTSGFENGIYVEILDRDGNVLSSRKSDHYFPYHIFDDVYIHQYLTHYEIINYNTLEVEKVVRFPHTSYTKACEDGIYVTIPINDYISHEYKLSDNLGVIPWSRQIVLNENINKESDNNVLITENEDIQSLFFDEKKWVMAEVDGKIYGLPKNRRQPDKPTINLVTKFESCSSFTIKRVKPREKDHLAFEFVVTTNPVKTKPWSGTIHLIPWGECKGQIDKGDPSKGYEFVPCPPIIGRSATPPVKVGPLLPGTSQVVEIETPPFDSAIFHPSDNTDTNTQGSKYFALMIESNGLLDTNKSVLSDIDTTERPQFDGIPISLDEQKAVVITIWELEQ
ncbi:MAG TPA: hypothetical protein PKV16_06405 [Caldisericia bacterium]|nr:hypothetical protein [Caldisericia bacterium]HPF49179.1 hypothetical protein [Caldisericia bacterium]HPI84142.1 hypothetical protein [Caldisericia bacterium]HPQ93399.1 hypothetical protein [Caldisericia bacterium]HRV75219.1 hypothetical protein [Caldisericia bacterium]